MSDTRPATTDGVSAPARALYDPVAQPELYDGILSKRIVAFIIDIIIIFLLMIPAAVIIFFLGIVTLGIGWLLYPLLLAIVGLGYAWFTLGGPASATIGMRSMGIAMRTWDGKKLFPLLGVMHSLIFYVSVSILTPLILLVGLFTERKQLVQDLLLGVVALNADALRRIEGL